MNRKFRLAMELAVAMLKAEFQAIPSPVLSSYKKPYLCPKRCIEYLCAPSSPVSRLATLSQVSFLVQSSDK